MTDIPVSPRCPDCDRPTPQTGEGAWKRHRAKQDPWAPWCPASGTKADGRDAYRSSCWECSQKDGHAKTGGAHEPWHCKPDLCPDKAKHAEQVYGERLTRRYGGLTRDGVSSIVQIDGVDATKTHEVEGCICGLFVIWTPKAQSAPKGAS